MCLCVCSGVTPKCSEEDSNLLAFRIALKDESAERRLPLLTFHVAPVPALHHKPHQPGVLLVGRKLADISELELRGGRDVRERGRGVMVLNEAVRE